MRMKCHAQGHNSTPQVKIEPVTLRSAPIPSQLSYRCCLIPSFWCMGKATLLCPNFKKVGTCWHHLVRMNVCMYVCVCVCVCVCMYVCMYGVSRYRLETSCMDSSWENNGMLIFPELSPLVKLFNFGHIFKFITDRSKAVVLFWFSVACFWCQSFGDVSP